MNITGGLDMTLLEVDEAANAISNQVDPDANIIFGAAFDPSLQGSIRVSVVATGMDGSALQIAEPQPRRSEVRPVQQTYTAEPAPAPAPAPVAVAPPIPVTAYEAPQAAEPKFEPLRANPYPATRPVESEPMAEAPTQPDLAFEPEPVAAVEPPPVLVEVERPAVVARIVDESVMDEPELIFPQTNYNDEPRNRRGGFLGLFGRPRYEPAPQARSAQVSTIASKEEAEDADDLEIPSFLRRLAN